MHLAGLDDGIPLWVVCLWVRSPRTALAFITGNIHRERAHSPSFKVSVLDSKSSPRRLQHEVKLQQSNISILLFYLLDMLSRALFIGGPSYRLLLTSYKVFL
jgi:hypothetical protein